VPRTGRRPGDSGAREAILDAARRSFGTAGYGGTTIRGVAREAGVDPALVHHYFGSKADLFAAALELPVDPTVFVPQLLAGGLDGLGERLVRFFFSVWDGLPGQGPMLALLRSAVTDEQAAASLRAFLTEVVLGPLARAAGGGGADLRASLCATQMVGLAFGRYVLKLDPLASAGPDVLGPAIGPTLDRYLRGDLG
jgi:AcrR family transcriptional regulator